MTTEILSFLQFLIIARSAKIYRFAKICKKIELQIILAATYTALFLPNSNNYFFICIISYLFLLISNFVSPSLSYSFRHETHSTIYRSSRPEVFLEKGVLKICSKFTRDNHAEVRSLKLLSNFIEITLRHGCSPVNLLHIFRTPFLSNTSG